MKISSYLKISFIAFIYTSISLVVYSNDELVFEGSNSNDSISFNSIDTLSIDNLFNKILIYKDDSDKIEINLKNLFDVLKKQSLEYKNLQLSKLNLKQDEDNSFYYYFPIVDISSSLPSYSKSTTNFMLNDSVGYSESILFDSKLSLTQNLPLNTQFSFSYLNGISTNLDNDADNLNKGFNFSLSTPIFYGMDFFSDYKSKTRTLELNRTRTRQEVIDFQYSAISKFFNLFRVQSRFDLDKKGYELSIKNYNEVLRKYKIGILPEVDLLDLQLNMEKNKLSFLLTNHNLELALKEFNLFLGLPIESNTILKYIESNDVLEINTNFEQIEKVVLSSNLGILGIKDALIDKEIDIANTFRSNFVNGSLSFFYNLYDSRSNLADNDKFEDFYFNFDNLNENKGFSFTINIPIFNKNIFTNSLEKNKFELKLTKDNLKKKESEVKLELNTKLDDIDFNRKSYLISIQSNDLAQKIYDISIKRFDNGLLTSKDLIQNQINFLESNLQLINSRIDLELSIYELKRFIGEDLIYGWR